MSAETRPPKVRDWKLAADVVWAAYQVWTDTWVESGGPGVIHGHRVVGERMFHCSRFHRQ